MAKAVFIQSSHSDYNDNPGTAYHFPKRNYLSNVLKTVGDWVVFYEGRRGGNRGYYGVQRVLKVEDDPSDVGKAYVIFDKKSELSFEANVPRLMPDGVPYETGLPLSRGKNTSSVRLISDADFDRILVAGFQPAANPNYLPRTGPLPTDPEGFAEPPAAFEQRESILVSRKLRDRSFARQVKAAYRGICAISGLELRNGGGRPEVEAAHIVPVSENGPDVVANGLALSGTVHWMFDRGLVAVDENNRILVASDSVAVGAASRLIAPEQRLILPDDPYARPHQCYLAWHREHCFTG